MSARPPVPAALPSGLRQVNLHRQDPLGSPRGGKDSHSAATVFRVAERTKGSGQGAEELAEKIVLRIAVSQMLPETLGVNDTVRPATLGAPGVHSLQVV